MPRRTYRRAAGLILTVWTLLLLWLTLWGRQTIDRTCYLIPLQSTIGMFSYASWYEIVYLVVGNIAWFIPIGFLLAYTTRIKLWLVIVCGAGLSILIEGCQYLFSVGVTDIDDLIFNTLGTAIGVLLYYIIKKKLPHRF